MSGSMTLKRVGMDPVVGNIFATYSFSWIRGLIYIQLYIHIRVVVTMLNGTSVSESGACRNVMVGEYRFAACSMYGNYIRKVRIKIWEEDIINTIHI